ncbi:PAS domain-containing sensor histidine kinase [Halosolutus gelatinilyticus]|uniref:sensor histidine kinase n=1 Tax=Halosolutus gelatinilyticus TaxID=2931975 RepID=UPI001FF6FA96|nr:PAS domain-containing sensor histidine kinase [Halosolutus gelatinilyticus]
MNRPRVLCVSSDRSARASITLALTDTPINVVIAQDTETAVRRLERESIDAILVDADSIGRLSDLVASIESAAPETPTFVCWSDDGSIGVLGEVVGCEVDADSTGRLAAVITDRLAETGGAGPSSGDASAIPVEKGASKLDAIVGRIRRQLVGATSPVTVERVLREEFTESEAFTFAWVGEYDHGERAVVPWLTDPEAMEWPMQRTFAIGDGEQPLLERAMHDRDLQHLQPIAGNGSAVPFGDHAVAQGVRSVAIAPLASAMDLYGVLVVYAHESLSPPERETIASAAETASHVLESIVVRGRLDQQEQALHRYERLVETAGDGMCVLDATGHFTTVNDAGAEMTGYSREGLLGEHVSLLFDEDDVEAGEETIRTLLERGDRSAALELSLKTKTGSTIPCEITIAPLVRDGTFRGTVGVARDVTERKRSERKLREQNERLDAFAQIVSHDLRNPLGVSQGYLDLVAETESLEHVENVRDGLDRIESIIEDVLAIARDGEWAADVDVVDLERTADEAWEHVSTREATLSTDETMSIAADRSRFLRLLENCFRNSVEHGGNAVTVRVGPLGETDDSRGFFVEDDGRGLPQELRERIFDPSVSSSSEGLGIGLWIVREVATGHGWSVTATESENGGARFEFETGG